MFCQLFPLDHMMSAQICFPFKSRSRECATHFFFFFLRTAAFWSVKMWQMVRKGGDAPSLAPECLSYRNQKIHTVWFSLPIKPWYSHVVWGKGRVDTHMVRGGFLRSPSSATPLTQTPAENRESNSSVDCTLILGSWNRCPDEKGSLLFSCKKWNICNCEKKLLFFHVITRNPYTSDAKKKPQCITVSQTSSKSLRLLSSLLSLNSNFPQETNKCPKLYRLVLNCCITSTFVCFWYFHCKTHKL